MIKNYLLTAFRNVLRYKGFSIINILGLSLSMSVCMVILVLIQDQYSYDEMHHRGNNIYRVQQVDSLDNIPLNMASKAGSSLSKILAGPECTIISGATADDFITEPSGAKLPHKTDIPPFELMGRSTG